jgi:general secretion pathway protein C
MLARLSAFVIWALVAATAVFWGLRLFVRAPVAPAYAVPVGDSAAVRGDLTRLLGSAPVAAPAAVATPQAASRFKLLGIVAPKYASTSAAPSTHGVALIAVDGKMAKAYPVGARVDNDLVLQSVSLRTVSIGSTTQGAPTITLELPPLAAPATGTLPVNIGGGTGVPLSPSAPVPQYVPPAPPLAVPQPPQAPPANRPDSNAPTQ